MFDNFETKNSAQNPNQPATPTWEEPKEKHNILAPPPPAVIDPPASSEAEKKERWTIYIIVAVFFLALLCGAVLWAWYYIKPETFPIQFHQEAENTIPPQLICKNDSKLCPDGSIVKRISPNCDFAVCPEKKSDACLQEGEIIILERIKEGNIRCCQGLRIIAGEEEGLGFCAKCGDNDCVSPENNFNCPEDCQAEMTDLDSDNDGLTDKEESEYGTDPQNSDSDNDGYTDGQEVKGGYNPLGAGKLF